MVERSMLQVSLLTVLSMLFGCLNVTYCLDFEVELGDEEFLDEIVDLEFYVEERYEFDLFLEELYEANLYDPYHDYYFYLSLFLQSLCYIPIADTPEKRAALMDEIITIIELLFVYRE